MSHEAGPLSKQRKLKIVMIGLWVIVFAGSMGAAVLFTLWLFNGGYR